MTEEKNGGYWHMDKRIAWSHVLSTAILLLGLLGTAINFTSKMAVHETDINHNKQAIRDLRTDQANQYTEIIRRLERLDSKLDAK